MPLPDREGRYATALDLQAALDAYLETQEERGSARDLGNLLGKQFDADRIKIRGIIEEQLRGKSPSSPGVESHRLPMLDAQASLSTTGATRWWSALVLLEPHLGARAGLGPHLVDLAVLVDRPLEPLRQRLARR